MKAALVKVRPWDTKAGARVDVYAGDAPSSDLLGTMGQNWEPALSQSPQLSIELSSPDIDGKVQVGTAKLELDLRQLKAIVSPMKLMWRGAVLSIFSDEAQQDLGAVPEFTGLVTSARLNRLDQKLAIEASVSTAFIEKPLLTAECDGGGGLGGDAAKRGTLKPAGFGSCKNVPPLFIDEARNIGMVDGYGNLQSVSFCGEGRSSLGSSVGDYATYAALAAAIDAHTVPPGRWATCLAQGLIGLGAPPAGVVTVDCVFGVNRPGALMRRWFETHAGVPTALLDTASFTALDASVNRAVHYWTDSQANVKDLAEQLAASCNATPLVSFQGKVGVTRAIGGANAGTLDFSGRVTPRVIDWRVADNDAPFYKLRSRAARPALVLSRDQINFTDSFVPRGLFNSTTVYRAGNISGLADGSTWLYYNALPTAGNTPFVGSAYWQSLDPATIVDFSTGVTGATKPANNATVNRWYVATTDPGGANGDGWKDTSTTPAKLKLKIGSTWFDVSSLVTDTAQITDGANLGLTALWTGVVGSGKPEDFATSADNMIFNGGLAASANGWTLSGGAFWTTASGPSSGAIVLTGAAGDSTAIANSNTALSVSAGTKVFVSGHVYVGASSAGQVYSGIDWYDAAGTYITSGVLPVDTGVPDSVWTSFSIMHNPAPTGAAKAIVYFRRNGGATVNRQVTGIRVAKTQPAADVTLTAQIVVDLTQNKTIAADYTGALTGSLPVTFSPSVKRGNVSIKIDDATTYTVTKLSDGTAGGDGGTVAVDNTNGSSTKGDVSVSAMTDNKVIFRLKVFSSGVLVGQFDCTLEKQLAAAPGGGAGGGGTKLATRAANQSNATSTFVLAFSGAAPQLTLASGEKLYASYTGSYTIGGTTAATRYGQFKHQYSTDGSTWTDFGSAVTGSATYSRYSAGFPEPEMYDAIPGSVTINQNVTGLSAGNYYVRTVFIITTTTGSRTLSLGGETVYYEAKT